MKKQLFEDEINELAASVQKGTVTMNAFALRAIVNRAHAHGVVAGITQFGRTMETARKRGLWVWKDHREEPVVPGTLKKVGKKMDRMKKMQEGKAKMSEYHWHCVKCGDDNLAHQDDDLTEVRACQFCSGQVRAMTLREGARFEQAVALGRNPLAEPWGEGEKR